MFGAISTAAPNARLALQMRDHRRCTQGVIVQEANLLGPLGKQLIGNVRADEARATGEQIDTFRQMNLLAARPCVGLCEDDAPERPVRQCIHWHTKVQVSRGNVLSP